MDLAHTYDDIADDWTNEHKDSTWWMPSVDAFIGMLPAGGRVLDVGCGSGLKAKYLTDHGVVVTGMDISPRMIALARAAVPDASFSVGDVRGGHDSAVSVLHEQYDGVMLFASLLHIPKCEVDEVLTKVRATLTPSGVLFLSVKQVKEDTPEEEERQETQYGKTFTRFFSYFTADELRDALTHSGFVVERVDVQPEGRAVWIHVYAHIR